jgi:serine/threonine protein kinase
MLSVEDKIGEYHLVEYIDSGAFGEVWKAEKRTSTGIFPFAMKFFLPKSEKDKEKVNKKVRKEVATSLKLYGTPHIVSIVEADMFKNYVYIVSEFADGGSLGKWLKFNSGKAPSYTQAVEITIEILWGLESMHEKGIVHRDLKPDNVLLKNGFFCLADFGISREIKTHSKATQTAGTYQYMSPEAFESHVSVHTDIWAVGVILQELLTGRLPFPYEDLPPLVHAILYTEPEPMPDDVPMPLHNIVRKALSKDRESRFSSARAMRESLRDYLRTHILKDLETQERLQEYKKIASELREQLDELEKIISELERRDSISEADTIDDDENSKTAAPNVTPALIHEGFLQADDFYKNGYLYYVKGDYDLAINEYNQAIKLNSNYGKAYFKRGLAHHKKNNFVQAIKDYDKAIELKPEYIDAYYNRGNAFCSKKNYAQAVEDFNKVLELQPKNALAYKNRSTAYDKIGEIEKAQADLEEYYRLIQKTKL